MIPDPAVSITDSYKSDTHLLVVCWKAVISAHMHYTLELSPGYFWLNRLKKSLSLSYQQNKSTK